ncbi:hypothetical protein [Austwickia sp. TVS 96-490-7B]|uniref:hypothetical protein n=1 Tax=Austwickia sp. TVS 96-490-7B TaxID=2830843 RepID=UPI001C580ED1|nr:hypothetical protein [Austwickia sp. TVS 96-490-7B]
MTTGVASLQVNPRELTTYRTVEKHEIRHIIAAQMNNQPFCRNQRRLADSQAAHESDHW